MTGAVEAVQAGLVAAIEAHAGLAAVLTGVFDGPPRRAGFPHATIADAVVGDWSAKGMRGRELRVGVALHDDGERPGRLHALMAQAEDAIVAMPRDLAGGWRVAGCVFLRARVVRDADGPWLGLVELRVRVICLS